MRDRSAQKAPPWEGLAFLGAMGKDCWGHHNEHPVSMRGHGREQGLPTLSQHGFPTRPHVLRAQTGRVREAAGPSAPLSQEVSSARQQAEQKQMPPVPRGQGCEVLTAVGLHHRHPDPKCPQSDSASRRWRCPGDQHPALLPASPCGGPGTHRNRQLAAGPRPARPARGPLHTHRAGGGNGWHLPQTPGQRGGGTPGPRKGWQPRRGTVCTLSQRRPAPETTPLKVPSGGSCG